MLQLKNIYKSYTTGGSTQIALDGINLKFRQKEFVVILGPSGSGKTTFLNIIGGLERCDKGDLILSNKSTKSFTKEEWDFYRNNNVGFIFKEYNLIPHLSVLENVQIAVSLKDINIKEKKKRAQEALERVGLKDYISRTPDKLSKLEMQKVAIARALVNDPKIVLADEPTGNLDGNSSLEIMNLIKDVFKDKLVIVVSQNYSLAKSYATRIVEFRDAEVIYDSNPHKELSNDKVEFCLNKTKIKFETSLKLAIRDLSNKKIKTGLCVIVSAINVAIIAMLIALVSGFMEKINSFENDTLNDFPIVINRTSTNLNINNKEGKDSDYESYDDKDVVYLYNEDKENKIHNNNIDRQYIEYIKNIDDDLFSAISYKNEMNMNILKQSKKGEVSLLDMSELNFYTYPQNKENGSYLQDNYDLLYGYYPASKEDVVLILDKDNRIDEKTLELLGIECDGQNSVKFDDIIGKEYKIISNDDLYKKSGQYFYIDSSQENLKKAYSSDKSTTVTITGILKPKDESIYKAISEGVLYSNEICNDYISQCNESEIVKVQKNLDYNIMTGQLFKENKDDISYGEFTGINSIEEVITANNKEKMLCLLGDAFVPTTITIYPKDFDSKNKITAYLNEYNKDKAESEKIYYTDTSNTLSSIAEGILSCIILVFLGISVSNLFISIIMIAMITYISISDRRKEICVFKMLGARDRDIKSLFKVQVALIGLLSGIIGISICSIFIIPVNSILSILTSLDSIAYLSLKNIILIIVTSIFISILGSTLPRYVALKKDFVSEFKK